jgi:hypothetical protein
MSGISLANLVNLAPLIKLMRKALALSVIVTVLAVVSYMAKPSEAACFAEIKKEFQTVKLDYTLETLPSGIDRDVFAQTAEKAFLETVEIKDQFVYRAIYQGTGDNHRRIGWGAFGVVRVDVK